MNNRLDDLPPEIGERILSFMREVDGNFEVSDKRGLIEFIADNLEKYPALAQLVQLNEEALTKHVQETGEVPPGVKLIKQTDVEGENVTHVRIYNGPAFVPEDER
jgi:hypothetical protein